LRLTSLGLVAVLLASSVSVTAEDTWFRAPRLSIMTGFIYEPLKPYTIHQWKETLGSKFDADRWVRDFKEAGAQHLVFYDKWIDGLVFHDTKTTSFKTKRDFVGELAAACQRQGLPLVLYFNAVSDGNPEFDKWALLDRRGKPIVFSPRWPTRYQTLHSPFRQKAVEQVRELLTHYGPIHGIWHDIFSERLHTSSPWTAQGYKEMYGEEFARASGARLAEFNARTLAGYLDEIEAIRRERGQEQCVYTSNGSGGQFLRATVWTREVGSRLHYLFNEGHSFGRNDALARMAWVLPKPLEINLLLNSSWFTPLNDTPPPAKWTEKQVIAGTAIAVCQGAGVCFALTPGHSGVFGGDLQLAKAAGAWFRRVQPLVEDARPYADVGIVLGTLSKESAGLPARNPFWKRSQVRSGDAWTQAVALSDALLRAGVFSQLLYDTGQGRAWPESLAGFQAVLVPELATLDAARAEQIRQYVRAGGRLIVFGHGSMLDAKGQRTQDYALGDVLGVRYKGEAAFPARVHKTQVRVDSEYSAEFRAEHLVDGLTTAWASGGTPMPHWAEIILPEAVDVASVHLVSRQGPYLVADIDVEAKVEGKWKLVKSVRGATSRAIAAKLDAPVRTQSVRVKILRELYQGGDRQYADVESIRILDKAGRDRSTSGGAQFPLVATADDLRRVLGAEPASFPPMAVGVEPTTAEVVARLDRDDGPPAILRNRWGKGEALLITTAETAFRGHSALARIAAGEPTLTCSGQARSRYRFVLTRVGDRHVLHVIDPVAEGAKFRPVEVQISVRAERLGGPGEARLAGAADPLPTRRDGAAMAFTVRPDPVASIVLR